MGKIERGNITLANEIKSFNYGISDSTQSLVCAPFRRMIRNQSRRSADGNIKKQRLLFIKSDDVSLKVYMVDYWPLCLLLIHSIRIGVRRNCQMKL